MPEEQQDGLHKLIEVMGFRTVIGPRHLREVLEHDTRKYLIHFLEEPRGSNDELLPPVWAIMTDSDYNPGEEVWAFVDGETSLDELKDIIRNAIKAEMVDKKPE